MGFLRATWGWIGHVGNVLTLLWLATATAGFLRASGLVGGPDLLALLLLLASAAGIVVASRSRKAGVQVLDQAGEAAAEAVGRDALALAREVEEFWKARVARSPARMRRLTEFGRSRIIRSSDRSEEAEKGAAYNRGTLDEFGARFQSRVARLRDVIAQSGAAGPSELAGIESRPKDVDELIGTGRALYGLGLRLAPEGPRLEHRLALAERAGQLATGLKALIARWVEAIRADELEGGKLMAEYYERFRDRVVAVFDELVDQGLADAGDVPTVKEPPDPNAVARIAKQIEDAAARLRVYNPELAEWLEKRIEEVRGFQRELREQMALPVPDFWRTESIHDSFRTMNAEVMRRLRRDAEPWVGYYHETPEWYDESVNRVSVRQHQQTLDFYDFTIRQLAHIAEQVR